jgi:hypothetical protein
LRRRKKEERNWRSRTYASDGNAIGKHCRVGGFLQFRDSQTEGLERNFRAFFTNEHQTTNLIRKERGKKRKGEGKKKKKLGRKKKKKTQRKGKEKEIYLGETSIGLDVLGQIEGFAEADAVVFLLIFDIGHGDIFGVSRIIFLFLL